MTDDRSRCAVAFAGRYLGRVALGHHGCSAVHNPSDLAETLGRVEDAVTGMQKR